MDGVIFIRTLTEEQERILEEYKNSNSIVTNTKAIQGIIDDYDLLKKKVAKMQHEARILNDIKKELENELKDFRQFHEMLSRLQKKVKNNNNEK